MDAHGPTEHIVCQVCRSLTKHMLVRLDRRCSRLIATSQRSFHQLPHRHQLTVISPFRGSKLRHQRTLNQAVLKTKPSPPAPAAQALKRDGELVVDGSDTTHSAAHGSSPFPPNRGALMGAGASDSLPAYLGGYILGIRRSQLRGRLRMPSSARSASIPCVPNKLGFGIRWVGSPMGRRAPVDPGLLLLVLARVFHPGDCRPD